VEYRFLAVGGSAPASWLLATGKLPGGIAFRNGVLTGVARVAGIYPITIAARSGKDTDELSLTLVARPENLAGAASEVLVPSLAAARERMDNMRAGSGRVLLSTDPEVLRDGKSFGPGSGFLGAVPQGQKGRAAFGYRWKVAQEIGLVHSIPEPERTLPGSDRSRSSTKTKAAVGERLKV